MCPDPVGRYFESSSSGWFFCWFAWVPSGQLLPPGLVAAGLTGAWATWSVISHRMTCLSCWQWFPEQQEGKPPCASTFHPSVTVVSVVPRATVNTLKIQLSLFCSWYIEELLKTCNSGQINHFPVVFCWQQINSCLFSVCLPQVFASCLERKRKRLKYLVRPTLNTGFTQGLTHRNRNSPACRSSGIVCWQTRPTGRSPWWTRHASHPSSWLP